MRLTQRNTFRHNNAVYSTAFSPDGRLLASASLDNTVKIWELETGELRQTLRGHGDGVAFVGFLADGRIVTASLDKTVRVWSAEGVLKRTFAGHQEYLSCAAISKTGTRIASGGFDKSVRLWDADEEGPRGLLAGHEATVQAVAFSASGRVLASGGDDNSIRLWDCEERQLLRKLAGHAAAVEALCFATDDTLVSGGADGRIRVWNLQGEQLADWDSRSPKVKTLALSPTNDWLAAGGSDGALHIGPWTKNPPPSEPPAPFTTTAAHRNTIYGIAFAPSSPHLATAGFDRQAHIWELTE